jgi:GTP cyclohydrolase IA
MSLPDEAAMAAAVKAFLRAAGIDMGDENVEQTPKRVAQAWAREFLDGYQVDVAKVLGQRFPVKRAAKNELVVVSHLHFRSMCPHHLMPYDGVAHVAYLPGQHVVGFGRLSALVDAFAHRLVLQETLAQQVAHTLTTELKTRGAACLLVARQTCLTHRQRGEQHQAHTHAEAFEGVLRQSAWRSELMQRFTEVTGPQRARR